MKALLDTNFLRHLELVDGVGLLSSLIDSHNWDFTIPQIVINELSALSISESVSKLIDRINIDCCTAAEFSIIKQSVFGLDPGELEAICIVNKCEDRKFKDYLILTDDCSAQRKASDLGMSSLDVVSFLFFSNEQGILSRDLAMNSLQILRDSGYYIDDLVWHDFEQRLK